MEHLMEIMTTGTETFCIVLLLNTFFERKYTTYRFFFPLSAAFLFYLWLPLNTILATSFVTKLFISILIWLVFSQIFYTGALPFHLFLLCSFFIILSGLDYFTLLGISYIFSFSFSDALSNSALYILGAFVSRTLLLLFSIIIYRLFKAKTSMILSSSTWIALLLFPVFINICGAYKNEYCVLSGYDPQTVTLFDDNGTAYESSIYFPVYAFITKEDYWNGSEKWIAPIDLTKGG